MRGRDLSVSVVTNYDTDDRISVPERDLVQTGCMAYPIGTGSYFAGG
jgi:hypothetical protein